MTSPAPFKAACIQTSSLPDIEANIEQITPLVRQAATSGAELICLPENVVMMEHGREAILSKAKTQSDHPALSAFGALARETKTHILIGSLAIRPEGAGEKIVNRSFLLDGSGGVVAHYDKIHMFDVDLEGEESYRESATYQPGEKAVLAATPWGKLGLTICYDLRFPYLYRALAHAGASFLSIPAAFTRFTGQAHWHTLLRARAIETGCFVFAPAQCGEHSGARQTYGHSLIIDPWGKILAEAGEEPGVIMAKIDPARVAQVRGMVPSLSHDRPFAKP